MQTLGALRYKPAAAEIATRIHLLANNCMDVVGVGVRALVEIGDTRVVPELLDIMRDSLFGDLGDETLFGRVLSALPRLPHPSTAPRLLKWLHGRGAVSGSWVEVGTCDGHNALRGSSRPERARKAWRKIGEYFARVGDVASVTEIVRCARVAATPTDENRCAAALDGVKTTLANAEPRTSIPHAEDLEHITR